MDQSAKQQVVERLKGANNVLVTVSNNPSVDQLAGAIAMTIMVNAMGKHATAVFSGKIPDTMQFLEPTKTLEETVDSLRDFIISLDKSKADKLRYKVENDVVKIFITPYRTRISESDLVFSQGDYNVDAVLALGVHKKDDLDKIIVEHGRILHDAAVISVNTGVNSGDLGSINWTDATASSLCEMLMSISEALQSGLVDEQVATALLTGIVSETDRFSNEKTTPKVMTMSAQLMAAGANQQLIASNLHPLIDEAKPAPAAKPKTNQDPSEMDISHSDADASQPAKTEAPKTLAEIEIDKAPAKSEPPYEPPKPTPAPVAEVTPMPAPVTPAQTGLPSDLPPGPIADMIHDTKSFSKPHGEQLDQPLLGGTFNATTTEARETAAKAQIQGENNTILAHDTGDSPDSATAVEAPMASRPSWQQLPSQSDAMPPVPVSAPADDFSPMPAPVRPSVGELDPARQAQALDNEKLATIDVAAKQSEAVGDGDTLGSLDLDSARKAVEAAMGSVDFSPENNPVEAVGTAGEMLIQPVAPAPEPAAPQSEMIDLPPSVPPPFAAPPPNAPPVMNGQHSGGLMQPPAAPAEASPQDFTLPTG